MFDFGDGDRDFSMFLDLPRFLRMARDEDLFVIFRPGPYICGEWEFGGLPRYALIKNLHSLEFGGIFHAPKTLSHVGLFVDRQFYFTTTKRKEIKIFDVYECSEICVTIQFLKNLWKRRETPKFGSSSILPIP